MRTSTKTKSEAGKIKTGRRAMPDASEARYELPPLVFSQPVKDRSRDILAVLNRPVAPEAVEFEKQTSEWASLVAPLTNSETKGYSGLYGSATEVAAAPLIATKRQTLTQWLRILVDEWIDSGVLSCGAENASDRNFEKSPAVSLALYSFSKSGHLMLLPYGKAPTLWLEQKHMEHVGRKHDPQLDYVQPLSLSFEEIAQAEMTFILLSDLRWRLSKCRKCGVYFLMKHLKRTYSGGIKCELHSQQARQANQLQATAQARANAKVLLYELAAAKFRKKISGVAGWQNDKALKSAIAEYLNVQIQRSDVLRPIYFSENRRNLSGKWTAQPKNWQGIEAALETTTTKASAAAKSRTNCVDHNISQHGNRKSPAITTKKSTAKKS
jgi:hypothetical protein